MALLVLEVTAVFGVIAAGRIEEFALPRHDLADWLSHTSAETAFAVAGRLVAAVLTTWLVAGTVLCLAASWSRRCRRACRFSPALTRRLVESAMAITLTTSSTIVISVPAHAAQAPSTVSHADANANANHSTSALDIQGSAGGDAARGRTDSHWTRPSTRTDSSADASACSHTEPRHSGLHRTSAYPAGLRSNNPSTASGGGRRRLHRACAYPADLRHQGFRRAQPVPPESVAPTTMSPWFDEGAPRTPRSGQQQNPRQGDARRLTTTAAGTRIKSHTPGVGDHCKNAYRCSR